MAQVATQPVNLEDIFGSSSMYPAYYGNQIVQQNQQASQINQGQALQDMFQQEQQFPLEQQKRLLANQTAEAQLPGIQAQSRSLGYKADREGATQDDSIKALRAKLTKDASDEELGHVETFGNGLTQWGNIIKQNGGKIPVSLLDKVPQPILEMYQSQGPDAMLKLGSTMLNSSAGIMKERLKQKDMLDRQAQIEAMRQAAQDRRAAAVQAAKAKILSSKTDKPSKNPFEEFSKAKAAYLAAPEGSPEKDAWYEEMQKSYKDWEWAQANKPVAPGTVNVPGMANLPENKPAPAPRNGNSNVKKDAQGRILLD